MTTIQSSIAVDLDAFQDASWFTSTYLVCSSNTHSTEQCSRTPDRGSEHHSSCWPLVPDLLTQSIYIRVMHYHGSGSSRHFLVSSPGTISRWSCPQWGWRSRRFPRLSYPHHRIDQRETKGPLHGLCQHLLHHRSCMWRNCRGRP